MLAYRPSIIVSIINKTCCVHIVRLVVLHQDEYLSCPRNGQLLIVYKRLVCARVVLTTFSRDVNGSLALLVRVQIRVY